MLLKMNSKGALEYRLRVWAINSADPHTAPVTCRCEQCMLYFENKPKKFHVHLHVLVTARSRITAPPAHSSSVGESAKVDCFPVCVNRGYLPTVQREQPLSSR